MLALALNSFSAAPAIYATKSELAASNTTAVLSNQLSTTFIPRGEWLSGSNALAAAIASNSAAYDPNPKFNTLTVTNGGTIGGGTFNVAQLTVTNGITNLGALSVDGTITASNITTSARSYLNQLSLSGFSNSYLYNNSANDFYINQSGVNKFRFNGDTFTITDAAAVISIGGPTLAKVSGSPTLLLSDNVIARGFVTMTNGGYFKANSFTVASIQAGMTNGDCWVGMLSNSLQAVCMSNNVITFKILGP